ncbi:class I SAM-dependent methyltransferase [Micromonospora globbae]|uniref:class I SAM-dependent methyltransferase n=1 Tax=Micromonospora globbae TaxID=1894969 RepID=UPI003444856C
MTATITYTPDPAMSYWPTPPDVADDLVYWVLTPGHGNGEDLRVLEPSAGEGHLARVVRDYLPHAHITAVEPSPERAATLRTMTDVVDDVIHAPLEGYLTTVAMQALAGDWTPYDLVFMNPPFTLPGRREAWAEHVLAIYEDPHLLAPGGHLGAIVPLQAMRGTSRRVRAIRELCRPYRGGIEECDRRAFAASGTGYATALMWIQKPAPREVD